MRQWHGILESHTRRVRPVSASGGPVYRVMMVWCGIGTSWHRCICINALFQNGSPHTQDRILWPSDHADPAPSLSRVFAAVFLVSRILWPFWRVRYLDDATHPPLPDVGRGQNAPISYGCLVGHQYIRWMFSPVCRDAIDTSPKTDGTGRSLKADARNRRSHSHRYRRVMMRPRESSRQI